MRRTLALLALSSALVVGIAPPASPDGRGRLPEAIRLSSDATAGTGFRAEGIESSGPFAYAGSLATGTIVRVNLLTGAVTTLVDSADGPAAGLELHRGVLLVAGGASGQLRSYDQRSGDELAVVRLAPPDTAFINDVTVTRHAAYATDSRSATLYRVPIGRDGSLGSPEALTLTGDFELATGFNANGIVGTFFGRLVIAQSTDPLDGTGSALYAVTVGPDARTAVAERIELEGDVSNADGLVLWGRTLFVVENQLDRVAQIRLSADLTRGTVVRRLTDDDAATPTTATLALGALYAVNARFADINAGADPATLDYEVIRISLR